MEAGGWNEIVYLAHAPNFHFISFSSQLEKNCFTGGHAIYLINDKRWGLASLDKWIKAQAWVPKHPSSHASLTVQQISGQK